jgi:drug/metabolite transporter (DMT)-like permease
VTSILIFLAAIAFGLITAGVAQWKGRPPTTWLLIGLVGSIAAIPFLLVQKRHFTQDPRLALLFFGGAGLVLSVIGVIMIYRIQNTGAF